MEFAMKEDRESIDQKLSGAISQLAQTIGYNLTTLQAQSNKILSQQAICANHEQMRKEIEMIGSNQDQLPASGMVDFDRNWTDYRNGFGNVGGEFWLGLERMHLVTSAQKHELLVELKDFSGEYKYARYNATEIGSELEQYPLMLVIQ
uniref:Fibrinogen C-terminal domain-containing protein n=1 Tax=Anopheles melas TaxID=34690 RepID=A0A182UDH1_9DIPT